MGVPLVTHGELFEGISENNGQGEGFFLAQLLLLSILHPSPFILRQPHPSPALSMHPHASYKKAYPAIPILTPSLRSHTPLHGFTWCSRVWSLLPTQCQAFLLISSYEVDCIVERKRKFLSNFSNFEKFELSNRCLVIFLSIG